MIAKPTRNGRILVTIFLRSIKAFSNSGIALSGASLFFLMFLISADVTYRFFSHSQIKGTLEISQVILVVIIFFSVAFTQSQKKHVNVDTLSCRLSPRKQTVLDILAYLVALGFFILLMKQSITNALDDFHSGLTTEVINLPIFPVKLIITVGALLMIMQLIADIFQSIKQLTTKE
jgi:TRAP-type C4-dicarboxylate transport system permease small subunit